MDTNQIIKLGLLVVSLLGIIYLIDHYQKKKMNNVTTSDVLDTFDAHSPMENDFTADEPVTTSPPPSDSVDMDTNQSIQPVEPSEVSGNNEIFQPLENTGGGEFGLDGNQFPKDCFPKDQLSPAELLPTDANSKWAQSVPAGQGELGDQNFLTAGHHVGINTVGQTLRNANRQLRSEPPNPQVKVSPWLQTTIEADTNRRPLEIGGCE